MRRRDAMNRETLELLLRSVQRALRCSGLVGDPILSSTKPAPASRRQARRRKHGRHEIDRPGPQQTPAIELASIEQHQRELQAVLTGAVQTPAPEVRPVHERGVCRSRFASSPPGDDTTGPSCQQTLAALGSPGI